MNRFRTFEAARAVLLKKCLKDILALLQNYKKAERSVFGAQNVLREVHGDTSSAVRVCNGIVITQDTEIPRIIF